MLKNDSALCRVAKRLEITYNGVAVKANGEPTPIYYHLQHCDECVTLRSQQSTQFSNQESENGE